MPSRYRGRRRIAAQLTCLVALMHFALIVTFLIDPSDPPRKFRLFKTLWGWWHSESFIPLILVLCLAPPLSWLAWMVRGPHRKWLIVSWILFAAVAGTWYSVRVLVMLEILRDYTR